MLLIPHYQRKIPWERNLVELVPKVKIQSGDIPKINVFVYLYFMLIGRPQGVDQSKELIFQLPEQAPTDSVRVFLLAHGTSDRILPLGSRGCPSRSSYKNYFVSLPATFKTSAASLL